MINQRSTSEGMTDSACHRATPYRYKMHGEIGVASGQKESVYALHKAPGTTYQNQIFKLPQTHIGIAAQDFFFQFYKFSRRETETMNVRHELNCEINIHHLPINQLLQLSSY